MENTKQSGQRYERKPNNEFKAALSEDGRFWIFKDITTWIVPVNYLDTISKSKAEAKTKAKSAVKKDD